ncbi:MAG: hypothetical protein ACK2TV_10865, partial [Anaerolineales bacterium]
RSENWLIPLWSAQSAFDQNDLGTAMQKIHECLVQDPLSPLPAILHLKLANKSGNQEMLNNLSEIYESRWPKCLPINIIRALSELEQGKDPQAVERLHWVASQDSAGQVIQNLMGSKHRFLSLWPEKLEIYFDIPIPASVSAHLGWNKLSSGEMSEPEFKTSLNQPSVDVNYANEETQKIIISEDSKGKKKSSRRLKKNEKNDVQAESHEPAEDIVEDIQKAFSKLAKRLKKPELVRSDSRFPVYVIMTSKKQLESIYGPNTTMVIDGLLKNLVSVIQLLPDWNSMLFYPDDPASLSDLGLKSVIASDAYQTKLALQDLDEALVKRGEMIGALLIIGGPEIIPFHHLPNPTNDDDHDVPSDNPYGTIDDNYFIPQWPVGRLPGESGSDSGLLLQQIRQLISEYKQKTKKSKFLANIGSLFNWIFSFFANLGRRFEDSKNLGYSAEIWQKASEDVYKSVSRKNNLQLSPPTHSGNLILKKNPGHALAYFNLHGVKDGPYWYGQKDFSSTSTGPDYPIALSPNMFNENIPAPKLTFTEACYGANIADKQHEDAISLKFLDLGTHAFVGSTCIAYGSVTPPLIGADFLAESFWKAVLEGQSTGYALMQAKLTLAEEMIKSQGFLDGEDQKTILSFILLGDPLKIYEGPQAVAKPLFRLTSHAPIRTVSDSDNEQLGEDGDIPDNINKQVKKVVEKYLPGLQNAKMRYTKSVSSFTASDDNNVKIDKSIDPERFVITLQKTIEQNQQTTHLHYARMTFNKKGKLVKFTTSR